MIRKRVRIRDNENFWKFLPETQGTYDVPVIKKCEIFDFDDIIPVINSKKSNDSTLAHFYVDDFQFNRFWINPERYVNFLLKFCGVIGPDFSLYNDMPLALRIYNDYRNKWLCNFWQNRGIRIIPNVTWPVGKFEYFYIDGIPVDSMISISNVGIDTDEMFDFINEFNVVTQILNPTKIILYGKKFETNKNVQFIKHFQVKDRIKNVKGQ